MKDEKAPDKPPHFIIHPFLNVPRRGLGEAVHLGFRIFLAVLAFFTASVKATSALEGLGVPVKPMNDAFGKASRRLLAKP